MSSLLNLNEITFGFDLSMTNHKLYSLTLPVAASHSQNFWINESRFENFIILNTKSAYVGDYPPRYCSISFFEVIKIVFLCLVFFPSSDPYPSKVFEKSLLRNGMSTFIWTFNTLQIQTNALSASIILNKVFVSSTGKLCALLMVIKRKLKIIISENCIMTMI